MHPPTIQAKKRRIFPALALALGVWVALPAQAYLLDFTVPFSNPGTCIFYAGGYPSGPPLVGSNFKVIDVSLTSELTRKLRPSITLHNRIRKNDGLIAYFGIPRQTATDNFNPGLAASFASAPGTSTSTIVPSGNILNYLAPFSSILLLLGCGLMGLHCWMTRQRWQLGPAPHRLGPVPGWRFSGPGGAGVDLREQILHAFKSLTPLRVIKGRVARQYDGGYFRVADETEAEKPGIKDQLLISRAIIQV